MGATPELLCDPPSKSGGVALSGGGDSLLLLQNLVERDGCDAWIALHVDHGVRDEVSRAAERDHVDEVCEKLGVNLRRETLEEHLASSEEAMREARYKALAEMARDLDVVALGHHILDQVETILMKLLRGCDLAALSGMPDRFCRNGVDFIRPMMNWPVDVLEDQRSALHISAFEDPSNRDPRYLRNRFRHELLPLLDDLAPGWADRVAGLGDSAAKWKESLEKQLEELDSRHSWEQMGEGHLRTDREWLSSLDPYLLRSWCRRQLEAVAGGAGSITRKHVESFADFAVSKQLGAHPINFPGGWRLRGQKRYLNLLK